MRSKKALKNIISNLMFQISVVICNFILPILIIRTFGSNVNGLVSSITQFLAYITLLESGVGVVIRSCFYKPIANHNKEEIQNIIYASNKFFKLIAGIFVIYIAILCFVYPHFINSTFDSLFTISLILILSISTFFEYFFGMSYKLFLKADQKTYIISNVQTIVTILNAVIVVVLIKLGFSIQIVKLCASFVFIIRPIFQNIYVKKKYNISFENVDKNYKIAKKWDGLAQHIAGVIHNNTDTAILSFFSLTYVSIYAVYNLVTRAVKSLTESFTNGIEASFGDMYVKEEFNHLNKSFKTYEIFYLSVTTIVFICTFVLITPFVTVYTKDVTDANYFQPLFGYILVLSEYIYMIRLPYSGLVHAIGHFKETKRGAWIEAILNIILSVILIYKFELVGVVMATFIAMSIRTAEFIYYSSRHVLKRDLKIPLKMLLIFFTEFILSVLVCQLLPDLSQISYISWIIKAIEVFVITFIIVITINSIFYREEKNNLKEMLKRIIVKKN